MNPLGLFETIGEPVALGQVAMATYQGGQRTELIGGAGSPISGRPSRLPTRYGKEASEAIQCPAGSSVLATGVEARRRVRRVLCQTATKCTTLKYYELQCCAVLRCERRTWQFRWFVVNE